MAASKLVLRDLNFVRQELHSVKEKWLDIGMELGASPTELRKIAETHKQDYSICLNLMLMQWLEGGDASWKILCEALKSSTIDESSLSTQLYEKHCNEKPSGPTSGKSVKRAGSDDNTAPKAKRPKTTVPLPTSFPPEDFLRPQPPNRICYKCNKIPRTPLRPECCSTKLYCEPCSLKVKICSTHQAENIFKRDDEHFTLVPKLKVKCPHWKAGCDFKETASKVYREHLPHCTKGTQDTNCQKVSGNESGEATQSGEESGSNANKPSSELEDQEVWYLADEEPQPQKTTSTASSTTAPPATGTLKTVLSPKNITTPSLPTKKPNGDIPGQGGRIVPPISQQQVPKPSANVQSPAQQSQKPPGGSAFITVKQQAKSSANALQSPVESQKPPGDPGLAPVQQGARVTTQQVVYDVNQLASMIQQLPANQMVWCLHKSSGCTWKGVATQLIQHFLVCQYNPKNIQTKVKTEIKQESQAPPVAVIVPAHQPVITQQAQYIKQEPSSPQILFGGHQAVQVKKEPSSSNTVLCSEKNQNTQPCEYKAIGCREMVPKGKMKQHLQENIQHHLDLAIKRILQNEAKK